MLEPVIGKIDAAHAAGWGAGPAIRRLWPGARRGAGLAHARLTACVMATNVQLVECLPCRIVCTVERIILGEAAALHRLAHSGDVLEPHAEGLAKRVGLGGGEHRVSHARRLPRIEPAGNGIARDLMRDQQTATVALLGVPLWQWASERALE